MDTDPSLQDADGAVVSGVIERGDGAEVELRDGVAYRYAGDEYLLFTTYDVTCGHPEEWGLQGSGTLILNFAGYDDSGWMGLQSAPWSGAVSYEQAGHQILEGVVGASMPLGADGPKETGSMNYVDDDLSDQPHSLGSVAYALPHCGDVTF